MSYTGSERLHQRPESGVEKKVVRMGARIEGGPYVGGWK